MTGASSSAQEHYLAALRNLGVAEGSAEPVEQRTLAALIALVESQLAALPRRVRSAGRFAHPGGKLPPAFMWPEPEDNS